MLTRAILEDHFSPVIHKIASEQDAFAAKTMRLNAAGNVLTGLGSAMLGFGAKSIAAAGKVDEFRRVVEKVRGANEAAFATKFVNNFDKHSSFAYFDLIDAAKMLEIQNVDLGKSFGDVADLAATSGRSLIDVARVFDAVKGGNRIGLGLSARGGFAQFGISPKEIFAAEGIPYTGKNLQNSMTADQLFDGLHKVLVAHGKSGYDAVAATTTLRGAKSMIEGAVERLETNVGTGKLPETVALLNKVAGAINHVSESIEKVPGFGDKFMMAGAAAVGIGTAYKIAVGVREWKSSIDLARMAAEKGAGGWKKLSGAKKLAEIVAKSENKAEIDKLGTLSKETDLLETTTGKWGGLKGALTKVGIAASGVQDYLTTLGVASQAAGAEGASAATLLGTGIATLGLYAVGLGTIAWTAYNAAEALKELGDASTKVEAGAKANRDAIKQGYDLKQQKITGNGAKSVAAQAWDMAKDAWWAIRGVRPTDDGEDDKTGFSAAIDKDWGKRKHTMAAHGLKATQMADQAKVIADQQAAAQKAKDDAAEAAGEVANKYTLPADLEYKLKHDERTLDLLKEQHATQAQINAAKAIEIGHLMKAHDLLIANAKLATDDKARYKMLDEAEEYEQKAKLAKITDKRDMMDKTIAQILGGGGISDTDIMQRAGVGRRLFRGMGSGFKPTADPLKAALHNAAKTPINIVLQLDGKTMQTIKMETTNEAVNTIIHLLETSSSGPRLGGQN